MKNSEELKELLRPIMLRRTLTTAGINLPPIRYGHVTLSKPKTLPADLLTEVDLEKVKAQQEMFKHSVINAESLAFLAPSVSTLRRYCGLMKVDALCSQINFELENFEYEKLVVFCIHKAVVGGITRRLWQHSPLAIYGETPPSRRQIVIDNFQREEEFKILVCNIGAAGKAINLTAASNVVFAEMDWVPGNNEQAVKRCHRIGSKNSVYVRTFSLNDSIDDSVSAILRRKSFEITTTIDGER